jgi:hypothetical protein
MSKFIADANSAVARKGFDYEFDVSRFISNRRLTPLVCLNPNNSPTEPYEFDLTTVQGKQLHLQMDVGIMAGPCGERYTLIPAVRVTNREIELVVDSHHYPVKRPSGFGLEWVQLVEEKTKRTLHTWELPYYAEALGVSADGSTLFLPPNFNIYASTQDTSLRPILASLPMIGGLQVPPHPPQLILALSESRAQFAIENELMIERETSGTLKENDPEQPYVGYKRFQVGGNSYVVRFQWPCT